MNESPLVPRRLYVYSSSSLLLQARKEDLQRGPLVGIRHLLYPRFLHRLALYNHERPAFLSPMASRALIKSLVRELFSRDRSYFHPLLSLKGMITILTDFIQELQEAGVTTDELSRAADSMENRHKWADLAALYAAYENALKKLKAGDSATRKERLIRLLGDNSALPFIDSLREIHFRSFYRLTELDFRLMAALAGRGDRNDQHISPMILSGRMHSVSWRRQSHILNPSPIHHRISLSISQAFSLPLTSLHHSLS